MLSLTGERASHALVGAEANAVGGEVSPNGRWLVYQSDRDGSPNVDTVLASGADARLPVHIVQHWTKN